MGHSPEDAERLQNADKHTSPAARIEWVTESIGFWRTLLVGLLIAYVGLGIQWNGQVAELFKHITKDDAGLGTMIALNEAGLMLISVFVFAGPVYESFVKLRMTSDLLLEIQGNPLVQQNPGQ